MEDLQPKIVKAEPGEVEHNITSEITSMTQAKTLARNILLNMPHYESFSKKYGVNAEGEYVLIFKLKQATLPPVAPVIPEVHIQQPPNEEEKKDEVPKANKGPKKGDEGGQFKIWDEFIKLAKYVRTQYPDSGKVFS